MKYSFPKIRRSRYTKMKLFPEDSKAQWDAPGQTSALLLLYSYSPSQRPLGSLLFIHGKILSLALIETSVFSPNQLNPEGHSVCKITF
jgi:hypothetical protein